tara:strand:- start:1059 stop:1295 length:237 start_codon:yes stop_codon:yes gene_type:complete
MDKEDLIKMYNECRELAKQHEAMLQDFSNRVPRVRGSKSEDETAMEVKTAEMLSKQLEASEKALDLKIRQLEDLVKLL